ncbi:hypothetical protein HKCCE3408_06175 [Rhodobacterales bacterium HKCCE3408]|nr:hypothetical protein [Rhodobacterales bacterium HKCCE3408]
MKRPRITMPKRPRSISGAVARSRKEAAIQLVRVEFDASRLEMAADQAESRAETHRRELDHLNRRRKRLLGRLKG